MSSREYFFPLKVQMKEVNKHLKSQCITDIVRSYLAPNIINNVVSIDLDDEAYVKYPVPISDNGDSTFYLCQSLDDGAVYTLERLNNSYRSHRNHIHIHERLYVECIRKKVKNRYHVFTFDRVLNNDLYRRTHEQEMKWFEKEGQEWVRDVYALFSKINKKPLLK